MAENKRVNVNNRVATPRVIPAHIPPALSSDNAIARAIGAKVQITTSSNPARTFEGHLFSVHTPSNILTITPTWPPSTSATPALTILPISNIQSFSITTPAQIQSGAGNVTAMQNSTNTKATPQPLPSLPALPPLLDAAAQQARLQAAITRLQQEDARRGKGVTKEAQEIFDALVRTLPTRWDGENIVVLDQILISKPYRVEDVKAGKDVQAQMIQRIKKVLEAERKKIAERSSGGIRKGG